MLWQFEDIFTDPWYMWTTERVFKMGCIPVGGGGGGGGVISDLKRNCYLKDFLKLQPLNHLPWGLLIQ